jgi:hypothetical protein
MFQKNINLIKMHVSEENTIVFDNSDGILAFPQCKMLVNSKNSRISSLLIPIFKNWMRTINNGRSSASSKENLR